MESKIKIVGKIYDINVVEKVDDEDNMGECNDALQRILVKAGQKPDQAMDTVIHEITHAIDYQMHLGLSERQVHCIAAGLTAVFLENPNLSELWNSRSNIVLSNSNYE